VTHPRRTGAPATFLPGLTVLLALTACSPAPDSVQDEDGVTLPDATAARLAGTQDFARARADAMEVDAELAAKVERLANAMVRAEACGEPTDELEREMAGALEGASLDDERRAVFESLGEAAAAQAAAGQRGSAGCN
jgi:hypothetical protein